jgi:hypothetical protein
VVVFLISLAVAIIGFVLTMTMHSLLGMLLIIGGVSAIGVYMLPDVIDRFTVFLSTGSFRRHDWRGD